MKLKVKGQTGNTTCNVWEKDYHQKSIKKKKVVQLTKKTIT